MKKLIIIIIILLFILAGMTAYKNIAVKTVNNLSVQEIENIENYISKIYMWKEITNEALPTFEDVNDAEDLWAWEVVKKNLENYEITYEEIGQVAKEIFGESFNKQFPKEGSQSMNYNAETDKYIATETEFNEEEDNFLLDEIQKTSEGYEVEIVEYLEDYSEENRVIIRNLDEEEIGRVDEHDSETKMQEIVKNNIDRFNKKKVYIKNDEEKLYVQRVQNMPT